MVHFPLPCLITGGYLRSRQVRVSRQVRTTSELGSRQVRQNCVRFYRRGKTQSRHLQQWITDPNKSSNDGNFPNKKWLRPKVGHLPSITLERYWYHLFIFLYISWIWNHPCLDEGTAEAFLAPAQPKLPRHRHHRADEARRPSNPAI